MSTACTSPPTSSAPAHLQSADVQVAADGGAPLTVRSPTWIGPLELRRPVDDDRLGGELSLGRTGAVDDDLARLHAAGDRAAAVDRHVAERAAADVPGAVHLHVLTRCHRSSPSASRAGRRAPRRVRSGRRGRRASRSGSKPSSAPAGTSRDTVVPSLRITTSSAGPSKAGKRCSRVDSTARPSSMPTSPPVSSVSSAYSATRSPTASGASSVVMLGEEFERRRGDERPVAHLRERRARHVELGRDRLGDVVERDVLVLQPQDPIQPSEDLLAREERLLAGERGLADEPVVGDETLALPAVELAVGDPLGHQQVLLRDEVLFQGGRLSSGGLPVRPRGAHSRSSGVEHNIVLSPAASHRVRWASAWGRD